MSFTDLLDAYDIRVLSMAWYTPETWQQLAAIPEAEIEITYPQFGRKCERLIADYTAQGFRV